MTDPEQGWLDRSAMGLSGLCVVHCLAGSVLLAGASITGGLWSHDIHAIGLMIALPLAIVALVRGARVHGRGWVVALGGAGLVLMGASLLMPHGRGGEIAVSVVGVALLGLAHLLNLRWSRR